MNSSALLSALRSVLLALHTIQLNLIVVTAFEEDEKELFQVDGNERKNCQRINKQKYKHASLSDEEKFEMIRIISFSQNAVFISLHSNIKKLNNLDGVLEIRERCCDKEKQRFPL